LSWKIHVNSSIMCNSNPHNKISTKLQRELQENTLKVPPKPR
jgi:hypothetical protein